MKVRIGNLEFSDVTLDEVDELVRRYGSLESTPASGAPKPKPPAEKRSHGGGGGDSGHQDAALLKRFLDAGKAGVPVPDISLLVGKKGKALRGGMLDWAVRVRLIPDKGTDPYEETRVGTKKGYRLKDSLSSVAQSILGTL